jgi:drug/metabolite transporter (DMT)-like permease
LQLKYFPLFTSWAYYGEFMALATAVTWSIGVFPFTKAARLLGPNQVNHLRLLLAVIILSIACMIIYNLTPAALFNHPTFEHYLWYGLSGIVGLSLGDYFSFTSFAILGTRTSSVFATLSPGTALLFGYIMLHEKLNIVGVIGMLVTIAGVLWLTLGKKKHNDHHEHHGSIKKGILFGILSALCQGAGLVLAKKGTEITLLAPVHATWIRMLVATVSMFLLTGLSGRIKLLIDKENKNLKPGLL